MGICKYAVVPHPQHKTQSSTDKTNPAKNSGNMTLLMLCKSCNFKNNFPYK